MAHASADGAYHQLRRRHTPRNAAARVLRKPANVYTEAPAGLWPGICMGLPSGPCQQARHSTPHWRCHAGDEQTDLDPPKQLLSAAITCVHSLRKKPCLMLTTDRDSEYTCDMHVMKLDLDSLQGLFDSLGPSIQPLVHRDLPSARPSPSRRPLLNYWNVPDGGAIHTVQVCAGCIFG